MSNMKKCRLLAFLGSMTLCILSCSPSTVASDNSSSVIEPIEQSYAPIKDGRLYYQVFGSGSPIIVLHGGPGLTQGYLLPQMLELAQDNQVVFYDQRGSGKSLPTPLNKKSISVEQFVNDLEALRKHLGYKKFTLVGHSWGGRLAMEYAIVHPEVLSGLVLMNSVPATYQGQLDATNELIKRTTPIQDKIKALSSYKDFEKLDAKEIADLYRESYSIFFYNPQKVNQLTLVFNVNAARSGFKVDKIMSESTWLQKGFDLRPQLKHFNMPTLIIQGDHDVIPVWTAEELTNSVPGSKLTIVENSGHFPYIEQPEVFFSSLHDFLNSIPSEN